MYTVVRYAVTYYRYLSYANSFSPVVLAIAAIVYSTVNIWRLNVLIPTVFVWVASVQSLGIVLHRQKNSESICHEKSMAFTKNKPKHTENSSGDDSS